MKHDAHAIRHRNDKLPMYRGMGGGAEHIAGGELDGALALSSCPG